GQRQIDLSEDAPMQDIVRPNGDQRSWNWANSTTAPKTGDIIYANNPYWIRRKNYQNDDTQRIFGKVRVSYDLLQDLTVSANLDTDYYTDRRQERTAIGSVSQSGYSEELREVQETNVQGRINYDGQLTESVSLQARAGVDYRYNSLSNNSGSTNGGLISPGVYTLENSTSRPNVNDYFQEKALIGVYGDVTVGYNDLVYLGGTLRNDWSSTLPADQNAYLYPSVTGSFVFSSLPALKNSDVLSFGKIRAGYSIVGRATDPYSLNFTYNSGTPFNGKPVKSIPSNLPNSDLKRELKTSFEVGARVQLFQNRLELDATYYQNETQDLIQNVSVSRASGFASRTLNAGRISNTGVELRLRVTPVATERTNWDVTFNWSKNVNEVEELAPGIKRLSLAGGARPPFGPQIVAQEGEPLGTFYGNGFKKKNGKKVVSSLGFYQRSGPKVLGTYRPDWKGSVSTSFSFGNFRASLLVDGQKGGEIWSLSNLFGLYSGMFQGTVKDNLRQLGTLPQNVVTSDGEPFYGVGGSKQNPTSAFGPGKLVFQTLFSNHAAHMYPATHIKLREATISYTLPQQWFEGVPVQRAVVSAVGRDLATLLKYTPNFDPTAITTSTTQERGFETGQLPPKRTLGLRVNVRF
ncbi:MAG: SusC/RagA family TonB-linked outer membrane protein, partial [Salinibacter sp.]